MSIISGIILGLGGGLLWSFGWFTRAYADRRNKGARTKKTAELEKIEHRVKRIPAQDLGTHLEMAAVGAFEAVHGWTRAANPLEREALQKEAITAVRVQLALLEEQKARGIV